MRFRWKSSMDAYSGIGLCIDRPWVCSLGGCIGCMPSLETAIWCTPLSGMASMADMLIVRELGVTFWYMEVPSIPRVVAMLAERAGGGMLGGGRSGNGRCSVCSCTGSGIFWSSEKPLERDCGLPEAESPEGGAVPPAAAAAAAACCWAMSFLEAFPRFLRSRTYSHVRPNSGGGLAFICFHGASAVKVRLVKLGETYPYSVHTAPCRHIWFLIDCIDHTHD